MAHVQLMMTAENAASKKMVLVTIVRKLTSARIATRGSGFTGWWVRQMPLLPLLPVRAMADRHQDPKPKVTFDKEQLKSKLTPEQYHVTQEQGTEAPWTGEYLTLKDNGMYACVVCGTDLFSSETKYESGCGWPSFYDVDKSRLLFKEDLRHGRKRTEVTCSNCDAHLGHVFDDGPAEKTGQRYCINSVSLRFKKKADDK